MKTAAKLGFVAAGYVAALLVAGAVVTIRDALTDGPDTSGGMYAFGQSLLFLAAFSVAAVPASGAALYFLRPHARFWRGLSAAALAVAATGGLSALAIIAADVSRQEWLEAWAQFGMLRMFLSPPFALAFLVACLFAPSRSPRIALLAATLIESAASAAIAVRLLLTR